MNLKKELLWSPRLGYSSAAVAAAVAAAAAAQAAIKNQQL